MPTHHPDEDRPRPVRPDATRLDQSLPELARLLYDDLRAVAARHLRGERAGHTLQPTALVHEAYLRLARQHAEIGRGGRSQFIALASSMMRRILIDHARARQTDKRGAAAERVTIAVAANMPAPDAAPDNEIDLLALDHALEKLAAISPEQARLVELRFFGGLNTEETAAALNIGRRSVDREWACAKAWLWRELQK